MQQARLFTFIFSLLVAADLIVGSTAPFYRQITKPLIVGALIIYFWRKGKPVLQPRQFRWTMLGLCFSLIGDIALLYDTSSPHFFTVGLGAFLTAHVFYCLAFIQQWNKQTTPLFWISILIVLAYGVGLFTLLKPHLGPLMIPVIVYILLILSMFITAMKRQGNVCKRSFVWVSVGALFFIISDSTLAIDKFLNPIPHALLLIMSTYAFAQYAIVTGLMRNTKTT